MREPRILVAGIGNVFLGDDGFGVEVARRLAARPRPAGVAVRDYGTRGFDLACALLEPYDRVVWVDVARRGLPPGTLYLLEIDPPPAGEDAPEPHGMTPDRVLRTARALGAPSRPVFMVACEPLDFGDPVEGRMGLSAPVEAAVEGAIDMVERLVERIRAEVAAHA